ncbi:DUF5597 domain-containing protein [Streptococcus rifensis]
MKKLPHFDYSTLPVLMVDDKPFIALAGEIHNSSASSYSYMEEKVWPKLDGLNLNTVLAPISWELIEPVEGEFDFSSVKYLLDGARSNNKKLILLWFGLWKNSLSTYIPDWMKQNLKNYGLAENAKNEKIYTVSPYSEKAVEKDSLAFQELVAFLKEYDQDKQTVIMIQIENEVGILGSDFDYSHEALQKLDEKVPEIVSQFSSCNGSWNEIFGDESKEYYLAYHFASAIERIADAGKKIYPIPYLVNAWLEKPGAIPGEYPMGGPTARMYPFWKHVASSIDIFSPDIYVPNFSDICDSYTENQSVLLVPETRQDRQTVSNFLYAVAKYNLFCFSPFAIEDFKDADSSSMSEVLAQLAIDGSAFNPQGTYPLLARAYKIVASLTEQIIQARKFNTIHAFKKNRDSDRGKIVEIENIKVRIKYRQTGKEELPSAGFILQGDKQELFLVGTNVIIEILSNNSQNVGLLTLEEGEFLDGKWSRGRVLNGDERYLVSLPNEPTILRVRYHIY